MKKILISLFFLAISLGVYFVFDGKFTDYKMCIVTFFELAFLGLAINCFLPKKKAETSHEIRFMKKGTAAGIILCILLIPLTVLFGKYVLYERKYYVTSLLLILEILLPFFLSFEGRKPKTGEIVIISVLCALAVLGRCAFYMLSQFKPTLAVVIIAGAALGGETGFLVGAISAFVSNIFFGQGPWTPWQMLATGIVGLFAGLIFNNLKVKKSRLALCIYGALSTVLLYGGILNPASLFMYQPDISSGGVLAYYISGLPFDLLHAESTVFFLWLTAIPILEKIERVQSKYGLI